ncbi:MAG: class I SAM-dependent methyltransferase [Acidimicrobiales bacterium]
MSENGSEERAYWDRRAEAWERRVETLSAFSDAYGVPAMDALRVRPGERVLDIGCGPGTTSIDLAARVAPGGEVTGVDISPAMVAAATRRSTALGAHSVRFVTADAQTDDLGTELDATYSRFGVMFFSDPVAAFANIGRSLRAGGRLACAVWGQLADNPWMFVPTLAAASVLNAELTLPGPNQPGPFSLADPEHVTAVLSGAGFVDFGIERVEGTRAITDASALDEVRTLLEIGPLGDAYNTSDESARQAAAEAVLAAIEPYRVDDGWQLPGVSLTITAHRP